MDKNRGIGKQNTIPWHIPEDFKHFKTITIGHPVIMGRKTFESIGKPLPGRTNIIVTRNSGYDAKVIVSHSLKEAVSYAQSKDSEEVFIIGGEELYNQGIELADRLYVTIIDHEFDTDRFFPDYSSFKKTVSKQDVSNKHYSFSFLVLER